MEEELKYSTLVFKCKGQPPPAKANGDSTIYSSVKREKTVDVSANTNDISTDKEEKRSVNATQSEAASHSHRFRLLVVCSVTLCVLTLLSIIAIIYISVMMNEGKANFEAKLSNLTAENQQLMTERSNLLNVTDNLNQTLMMERSILQNNTDNLNRTLMMERSNFLNVTDNLNRTLMRERSNFLNVTDNLNRTLMRERSNFLNVTDNLNRTLMRERSNFLNVTDNLNRTLMRERSNFLNVTDNLQNSINDLNWTLGVILKFNTFPVTEYCPQKQCQPCKQGWIRFQQKCYLFYESDAPWKSWTESRTFCQNSGSDLVVINSLEEQSFVSTKINKYYDDYHGYWIGLNRPAGTNWLWIDGRNVTLGFWSQTSDFTKPYALMLPAKSNTTNWNPADSAMQNKFICESDALFKSN